MRAGIDDFAGAAEAVFAFNRALIDAVCDIVPAVKVQIAYYEMYGVEGMHAFDKTCRYAASKGLVVMTDAKRNDIGATASCYAKAYLGQTQVGGEKYSAFDSDFLTVNGYLGSDGVKPFLEQVNGRGKGIFVLVKTSNPSSGELQDLRLENGKTGVRVHGLFGGRVGQRQHRQLRLFLRGRRRRGDAPGAGGDLAARDAAHLLPPPRLRRTKGARRTISRSASMPMALAASSIPRAASSAHTGRKSTPACPFDAAARRACLDMKEDLNRAIRG